VALMMEIIQEMRYRLILSALIAAAGLVTTAVNAQSGCGDPRGGMSVDYNNPEHAALLNNINTNHFNENVESLRGGQTSAIEGDLNYILFNAPNHHRALYATAVYHLRQRKEKFPTEMFSIHCWFDRAMRFAPTDPVPPMIYGVYLHRKGDLSEAERRYKQATDMAPDLAEAHYNLGLLYIDLRRFDEALDHAKKAYSLGYPLPALRQKLVAAGKWRDEPNP
jgi:tetratricopeptide (TPR) repeat protein